MRIVALLALLALPVYAQPRAPTRGPSSIQEDPIIGVRALREWYADSSVMRRCPAFVLRGAVPPDASRDDTPVRSWCQVDTSYALPAADATRWKTVVYVRGIEYPADSARRALSGAMRDTVALVTAVLYTFRDHALSWSPEWVGTVDRDYIWSVGIESTQRPDRSMLVGIRYCFNGTGGCWQRYLRRRDGRWTAVDEAFWNAIPTIAGGRIGKGLGISLATLTGSYGVYSDSDGNCCPSRELLLELDQRGDTLVLRRQRVRVVPP